MRSQLVLAAAAALLAAVARGAAAATCAVEAGCGAGAACLSGFSHAASEFPYTVDYTTTGDANSTTFIFKVCSTPCDPAVATCQPLASLRLRLADAILSQQAAAFKTPPAGALAAASCGKSGAGLTFNATQLGSLAKLGDSTDQRCELLRVAVRRTGAQQQGLTLPLSALCQQNVTVVDQSTGDLLFDQAEFGPSCLFVTELADGTSGVGLLYEDQSSGAYTDFQLDSLVSTPLPCSEFWQLGAAGYPPSEAAYRLGLIAVVEDIAASLGAASASLVQSVNTLCFPADTDLKRMRTTIRLGLGEGLAPAYLARLRQAVAGGAFKAAVAANGVAPAWAPAVPKYVDGSEPVCLPADSVATKCPPGNWDPSQVAQRR